MTSTRAIAATALAVLAGLVAAAAALAATPAPQPIRVDPAHLVVHGAPRTATLLVDYTDSSGIELHAVVALSGPSDAAGIRLTATLDSVTVSVVATLTRRFLYLDVPAYASVLGAPWDRVAVTKGTALVPAVLTALGAPLRARDARRLRRLDGRTFTISIAHVRIPRIVGLPINLPRAAAVTAVVALGHEGQLLDASVQLVGPDDVVHLRLEVTGFDQPLSDGAPGDHPAVSIAIPPQREVRELTPRGAQDLFGLDAAGVERLLGDLGVRLGAR